ncbi:hypothetical protein [Escherichia coli]|uniref:hypothetical protein n=1 Tax=Escherichia coli TaxID=562 RepID=UPI002878C446|nr:hypothetical protein [Escherichia coli]MDS1650738.1 hypothetical protein [Escherichia coli]
MSKVIGVMHHRFDTKNNPSFEVLSFARSCSFGTESYSGKRANGRDYFVMASSWRFEEYKEGDTTYHKNKKEKHVALIAKSLAAAVMGDDAVAELNFEFDSEYSRDYRNMAKSIINGDIPLTKYTGDK